MGVGSLIRLGGEITKEEAMKCFTQEFMRVFERCWESFWLDNAVFLLTRAPDSHILKIEKPENGIFTSFTMVHDPDFYQGLRIHIPGFMSEVQYALKTSDNNRTQLGVPFFWFEFEPMQIH